MTAVGNRTSAVRLLAPLWASTVWSRTPVSRSVNLTKEENERNLIDVYQNSLGEQLERHLCKGNP